VMGYRSRRLRLLDVPKPEPVATSASTALMVLDPAVCPACGASIAEVGWLQPALFWFGGHGGTSAMRRRTCRCGWSLVVAVDTVSPRLGEVPT
jgi:hypothetical protein